MDNPEEVMQILERFSKSKQKEIPLELDNYVSIASFIFCAILQLFSPRPVEIRGYQRRCGLFLESHQVPLP